MITGNLRTGLAAAMGMLVLILDSQTALAGMGAGLDLCIKTLIPSLFPFFVLSILMTGNLAGQDMKLLRPPGRLCGIPKGAESLLVTGFLGGYPVGAQNVAVCYERQLLARDDAQRLLAFCSNAGPAFLFGIIGAAFEKAWIPWALWLVHMITALIVGIITKGSTKRETIRMSPGSISLTESLHCSIVVMAQVCGWVVLFRMLIEYLEKWFLWMLPGEIKVILCALLELSNGVVRLAEISSTGARFIAASGILGIGGLCVTLQTLSVTKGLSLHLYFPGKLLQTALSVLMTMGLQYLLPPNDRCAIPLPFLTVTVLTALFLMGFLRKAEKNSSIPSPVGV